MSFLIVRVRIERETPLADGFLAGGVFLFVGDF